MNGTMAIWVILMINTFNTKPFYIMVFLALAIYILKDVFSKEDKK